jgi:hypothetical protein
VINEGRANFDSNSVQADYLFLVESPSGVLETLRYDEFRKRAASVAK